MGAVERRLWWGLVAYLAAIYATLYPIQFAMDALRARGWLRHSIVFLFALAALAAAVWLARRRPGWREWTALAASGLAYAALASRMEILQERIHLVQYGFVAVLLGAALALRRRAGERRLQGRHAVATATIAGTLAAGWIDEAIQAVLPNRVYDLRDVAFNGLAGALAVAAGAAVEAARRRDLAARGQAHE